jgi:hypothetical protein
MDFRQLSPNDDRGDAEMVTAARTPLLLVLCGVLSLLLASCDVLFSGVFSPELSQATTRADLASSIPSTEAGGFALSIVRAHGWDYVILYSGVVGDPTLPHLIVMTPDLKVVASYSFDFLSMTLTPSGQSFKGDFAMRDANQSIVIGNAQFSATAPDALTAFPSACKVTPIDYPRSVQLSQTTPSIPGSPFVAENFVAFAISSGNTLVYDNYAPAWDTYDGQKSVAIGSSGLQFNLAGVFTDPDDLVVDRAVLVFGEYSNKNDTAYFVQVPKTGLYSTLTGPLLGNTAYPQFTKSNLDSNNIFFTQEGMVAYRSDSRSWVRFTLDAPDQESSLYVGDRAKNLVTAFSITGAFYCTWNPDTRALTRYEKWWRE